jgi:hypothetical protein
MVSRCHGNNDFKPRLAERDAQFPVAEHMFPENKTTFRSSSSVLGSERIVVA